MVTDYLWLFMVAWLSATLLPGGSEVLLSALLVSAEPPLSPLLLWAVATAGNTLGAVVNWWLGGYLLQFYPRWQSRPWFPFKADSLQRSQRWFQRYGVWSLLLAWAPLVGDGLTFVAGVMRVGLLRFVVLVAVGKGARYAVLLWILLETVARSPRP